LKDFGAVRRLGQVGHDVSFALPTKMKIKPEIASIFAANPEVLQIVVLLR
jgi:hypothetical protein